MDLYQAIILFIGLLNLIAVPFFRSILSRLTSLEKEHQSFQLKVAKEYVTKDDMKEHVSAHLSSIEEKINSLEKLIKQSLSGS